MHPNSYEMMREFVSVHLAPARGVHLDIIDFGSQAIDDEPLLYRDLFDDEMWSYQGLDIVPGRNVDVVVADPYDWTEVAGDSYDVLISGQAFEHIEFFWSSIFETVRVVKPGGLLAVIAPSGGFEHRYPVDCYRYYGDGFSALARYADCEVVDVFTDFGGGNWSDSMIVMRKPLRSPEERLRFHRRRALQISLLPGRDAMIDQLAELGHPEPAGEVSVLASARVGALTLALDARRQARIAAEVRAEAERAAQAAAAASPDQSTPWRVYGLIRGAVARLAGPSGRRMYKRVRGRQ
jgi:SAM-dependent methyltransferase